MIARDMNRYAMTLGAAAVLSAVAVSASAGQPNYPPQPTVIEYTVDPAWQKRPAEFGPRAAVPSIAIDQQDRVWCLERCQVPVQVYSSQGDLVKSWGQGELKGPHSLRFDNKGNAWIADFVAHVVKKFTPEGKLLLTLGTPGKAGEDETHFNAPTDMAIAPAGDVFVSDGYGNRRVAHFDAQGKFVKAWGQYGGGPGQFCLPHQIVMDSHGALYVADRNSGRIQFVRSAGEVSRSVDQPHHAVGIVDFSAGMNYGCVVPRPRRGTRTAATRRPRTRSSCGSPPTAKPGRSGPCPSARTVKKNRASATGFTPWQSIRRETSMPGTSTVNACRSSSVRRCALATTDPEIARGDASMRPTDCLSAADLRHASRRESLQLSGKAAGGTMLATIAVPHVHAAEDNAIRQALEEHKMMWTISRRSIHNADAVVGEFV